MTGVQTCALPIFERLVTVVEIELGLGIEDLGTEKWTFMASSHVFSVYMPRIGVWWMEGQFFCMVISTEDEVIIWGFSCR